MKHKVKYQNILKSPNYKNYYPTRGEAKSGRYKYKRDHLDADVDRIFNISFESENESDVRRSRNENYYPIKHYRHLY